jgi:hypothetical protein
MAASRGHTSRGRDPRGMGRRPILLLTDYVSAVEPGDSCFCCGATLALLSAEGPKSYLGCPACGAEVDPLEAALLPALRLSPAA